MIGLAHPTAALALLAAGVLVLLHLYERRRRTVPVGTLFLWKRIPAQPLERQRFRPDLLFLLQLALVLALALGLLGPYVVGRAAPATARPLVAVLDASASMGAREAGGTRFEIARRRLDALLAVLPPGVEGALVVAAERPRVALRWTADTVALRARLEALAPLDVAADLGAAVDLALALAEARPGARVVVASDLPPDGEARLAGVHHLQVGRTDDNVGLVSAEVAVPPFAAPRAAVATVTVRNFSARLRRVRLVARVDEAAWGTRDVDLAAGAAELVTFAEPPGPGVASVILDAGDALAADDRAVVWIPPARPLDLLVVTVDDDVGETFAALGRAIPGSRIDAVRPAAYRAEAAAARGTIVAHGRVPADLPAGVPLLVAAPAPGSPVCTGARPVADAAAIDWDAEHPVTAALDGLEALELARATPLVAPAWARPVVLAGTPEITFPVLVAGESEGRRIACLGADLGARLRSSDGVPLLMLTLGVLRWLGMPAADALGVRTGVPVLLDEERVFVAERIGVQRAGERLVLANLFDERESDIGRTGDREWPATAAVARAAVGARTDLGWWCWLVAAALLALEWGVWARR